MNVNDEGKFPWLVSEKQFVREAIQSGKPVLGICLGAQMIAGAMGASAFPNRVKEIGWFPIHAVDSRDRSIFSFPPSETVFINKRAKRAQVSERITAHPAFGNQAGADFILAFWMVHEVPDPPAFLRQILSLLKPNGFFLLVEPSVHFLVAPLCQGIRAQGHAIAV